jgi:expansin (peptidoglycan-binding protein)
VSEFDKFARYDSDRGTCFSSCANSIFSCLAALARVLGGYQAGASNKIRIAAARAILLALLSALPAHAQPAGAFTLWLPIVLRPNANPIHQGIATYYNATGAGACSFDPSPTDLLVAAMNAPDYDNAAVCGEYVLVTGPLGTVTVRIVDLCPGCQAEQLDLSQQAFALIADLPQGVASITWQVVSPPLAGPIAYHFKDGSNQWWTAVQIRNHRNPIASFEYLDAGSQWVSVPRTSYNYFVQTNPGMGPGPYTFRVTDSYGNVLTDTGIPLVVNSTVNGLGQFPPGP